MSKERSDLYETCPVCKSSSIDGFDTWIQCDACPQWYHAKCLGILKVETIDRFYCSDCEKTHGPTTFKPEQRKSRRSREKLNYAHLNEGTAAGDERIWGKLLKVKDFKKEQFRRYKAKDVNLDLIRKIGMKEPFVIEENEPELEMKMPPADITVHKIAELVGKDTSIDVIDVVSQTETSGWTMDRWADYFENTDRDRIRNVISLEISESELAEQIERPRIVRELDWMDLMWPDEEPEYPKVQLYCLMGTKDSYTDFHIDFGGSSVFYHILRGSKTFYFIEPTDKNLKKYQKWSSSSDQSTTFLGDLVKDCYRVELKAGNTMIIPTGWIHAVFTPEDSVVIGGNFLNSFNVATQLKVYKIEEATQVPLKFRFPYYKKMNWYALENFEKILLDDEQKKSISRYEIESIIVLSRFLRDEVNENNLISETTGLISNSSRKLSQIPDSIQDPVALTDRVKRLAKKLLKSMEHKLFSELEKASDSTKAKNVIRLVLNVNKEATPPLPQEATNDEYVYDEEEEEEEDWKLDELEDDDDEYQEDSKVATEDVVKAQDHVIKPERKSRLKKVAGSKRPKDGDSSSDDDDSMGTRRSKVNKTSSTFSNRKRSLSNNSNSSQPSTAKQRIWGMINNKRY